MIDCTIVSRLLETFSPDEHEAAAVRADQQRTEVLQLFPKEGWPEMTLDRYALGQADHPDNFCRWMEFVTKDMGSIRGGVARKHLIFRRASGEWWFDSKAFTSVEQAWDAPARFARFQSVGAGAASKRSSSAAIRVPSAPGRSSTPKTGTAGRFMSATPCLRPIPAGTAR